MSAELFVPIQNHTVNGHSDSSEEQSNSDLSENMYMDISCGIAWTLLGLCVLGIVTNIISIVIYTYPSMRRAPINVLLTGLSVIDLCLSFLSIPAFVIPGLYASNTNNAILELLMGYSSVYIYPLTSMTYTASVWTFVAWPNAIINRMIMIIAEKYANELQVIASERWHAICGNGGAGASMTNGRHTLLRRQRWRSSAYALAGVCVFSIFYNFVRFFELRLVFEEEHADNSSIEHQTPAGMQMMVQQVLKNSTAYPSYMKVYYIGMFLVTHFAAPFIALLVLNGLTLRAVYVARQRRRRILTRRERKEHRTTWMMASVVVIFVLCYSLVFTMNIIEAVDADWFYKDENKMMTFALNDISNLLVVLNSATTAFIYFIFNRNYRESCMSLMAKWLACFWCCCWASRNRYYTRARTGDHADHGDRSNRHSAADGFELSDANTPCTINTADDDHSCVRHTLLHSSIKRDRSPPMSSISSNLCPNNNSIKRILYPKNCAS